MPFRELGFSASRSGGVARCRVSWRGRILLSIEGAVGAVPARIAGNVASARVPRGRRAAFAWPSTISAAWVAGEGGPECGISAVRVPGSRWRSAPVFPALLEYLGFCALVAQGGEGEVLVAAAGSPAAALAIEPAVAEAIPAEMLSALRGAAAPLRLALASSMAGSAATPGGGAALRFLRDNGEAECVAGRGEFGDAMVWTFSLHDGGAASFAVAGVTAVAATVTLQFPFIPAGASLRARWEDDALDYYVRDGLEIRPEKVGAATRAVVKTGSGGGFLLHLEG